MPRLAGVVSVVGVVLLGLHLFDPWPGSSATLMAAKDEFAQDRFPPPVPPAPFDARRALGYLETLCKIGPRISGSEGMRKQQDLLIDHFKSLGGAVRWQRFRGRQRSTRREVEFANLIFSWHPDRRRRVILCSHYDTRPIADQEPDRRRWREPFVSANDGGSGVALLMELAHHLKGLKLEVGIDLVFFDGEEYVEDPQRDEYFLGSKHFGREYRREGRKVVYLAAVLLDMVGGKDARFPIEQNSWWMAAPLVRALWETATEMKCTAFQSDQLSRVPVEDDHVPLNRSGIPAVDVIDFDYRHWHRLSDVPANCSGETLEQVARVLSVWLQRLK